LNVQGDSRKKGVWSLVLLAGAIAALVPVAAATGSDDSTSRRASPVVGAVYTETNDPAGNKVVVFNRKANGRLVKRAAVATGGNGSTQSVGCGPGCPILDSNYAVVNDGRLVFAVNAGSDTITSLRDGPNGLKRVDTNPSGGDMPEGIAVHDGLLYVLNVNTANSNGTTGNIYGIRYTATGQLSSITGSSQPLANFSPPEGTPGGAATARSISFKPNGRVIVVPELAAGMGAGAIDTFVVKPNGRADPVVAYPSAAGFPFGSDFNGNDKLVVANLNSPAPGTIGSTTTYRVTNSGNVIPIDTKSSNGELPCWVVVTGDNKHVFVVNTGDGNPAGGPPATLARYGLAPNGGLTFRGLTPERPGEFARTDAALSRNSKYLYVLSPSVGPGPPSHIDVYRVTATGGLVFIHKTAAAANLGVGATGLAAR
jgi:6-phosphogluconolactonase